MINKKWLILISVLAMIGFLIVFFYNISETPEEIVPSLPPRDFTSGYRRVPIQGIFLSPILLIIAVIPISYYFISKKFEEKLDKNLKVIAKLVNKKDVVSKTNLKKETDRNIILKFLNSGERKVVEKLIDKGGKTLQSEISRMEGMTKLKTHRAVKDLERKGIIKRESYGKTHRIILSRDIKELMLK